MERWKGRRFQGQAQFSSMGLRGGGFVPRFHRGIILRYLGRLFSRLELYFQLFCALYSVLCANNGQKRKGKAEETPVGGRREMEEDEEDEDEELNQNGGKGKKREGEKM